MPERCFAIASPPAATHVAALALAAAALEVALSGLYGTWEEGNGWLVLECARTLPVNTKICYTHTNQMARGPAGDEDNSGDPHRRVDLSATRGYWYVKEELR